MKRLQKTVSAITLAALLLATPQTLFAPSNSDMDGLKKWGAIATAVVVTGICLYGGYKLASYLWAKNKEQKPENNSPSSLAPKAPPIKSSENDIRLSPQNTIKGLQGQIETEYGTVSAAVIKVKDQSDSDGGGGASCGYHTVKNLRLLAQAILEDKPIANNLTCGRLVNKLFGFNSAQDNWRTFVINNCSDRSANGEWIGEEAVDALAKREDELNDSADIPLEEPFQIYAVSDSQTFTNPDFDWVTPEIAATLQQSQGVDCVIGVGINNAHGYEAELPCTGWWDALLCFLGLSKKQTQTKGTEGHWIGVLIHQDQNGNRHYFAVDSLNKMNLDDERLTRLATVVERRMCA